MNYFQFLGVGFGLMALLKPFYMHLIPWDENKFIAKAYSKNRPIWIIPVAVSGLALIAFTWYKEFTTEIPYSMIVSIMFSLTAIKAIIFIFDYKKFQKWVAGMLENEKEKKLLLVNILAGVFGLMLIGASLIFLY